MYLIYYAIYEYCNLTEKKGCLVLDGIVNESEATICPSQESGDVNLPHECELHKFPKLPNYVLETTEINIPVSELLKYKISK